MSLECHALVTFGGHIEVTDLAAGMHACIGAPRAGEINVAEGEVTEHELEVALHGSCM
jgi:hypothetical protein